LLGEWTDELGKDNYIKEWFSTGPKLRVYNKHRPRSYENKMFYPKLQKLKTPKLRNYETNHRKRY